MRYHDADDEIKIDEVAAGDALLVVAAKVLEYKLGKLQLEGGMEMTKSTS